MNLLNIIIVHFVLTLFPYAVSSGANDLHFYDGVSPSEVLSDDVFFEILDPPELRYSYRIRPAKDFGSRFNDSMKNARLVPTVPIHGCSDILNVEEIIGQVALSQRGECSFVFKTAKAQQAGARAIIITETVDPWQDPLDHLIEMVDDKTEPDIRIPAAFLLGKSGAKILRVLGNLYDSAFYKRRRPFINTRWSEIYPMQIVKRLRQNVSYLFAMSIDNYDTVYKIPQQMVVRNKKTDIELCYFYTKKYIENTAKSARAKDFPKNM